MTVISIDLLARDRASSTFNKVGRSAAQAGKLLGVSFGGAAIVGGLTKSISLAKDFDLTMRQIGVQTGQSGAGMKQLSALAMKMGADTAYSAQDAAGAMLELAKGGLTAAQIKAGALKTTMTLAAAGGLDLASSAGYVTQGMNTFGLSAKQASQVAVSLAGGANASTASVDSLGQALSQVGPGAKNAGLSIQETVAALSAFDNAGIKGSDAGTSLKTMLQRLVPTTKTAKTAMTETGLSFTNANGTFKSLGQIAQQLKTHLGNLSQVQRQQALNAIFGSDASRAATVLMNNGEKGVRKYIAATKDQTTVQKMANTAMTGASGSWEQLTGSVETAGIKIGTALLPGFTKAANEGADFINKAMTWGPELADVFGPSVGMAKGLLSAVRPLEGLLSGVGGAIGSLPGPVKSAAVEAAILALVLPRVTAGIASTGTAAMAAGARVIGFGQDLTSGGAAGAAAMRKVGAAAKQAAGIGGILALQAASHQTSRAMGTLEGAAGGAMLGFSMGGPIGAAVGGLAGGLLGLVKSTHNARDAFKMSSGEADTYAASLDQVTGAATRASRAQVLANLSKNGTLKAGLSAGVSQRTLIDAALGKPAAIQAVTEAISGLTGRVKDLKAQSQRPVKDRSATQAAADADRYRKSITATAAASKTLRSLLGVQAAGYASAASKARMAYYANSSLSTVLKGFPKQVKTNITANGVEHSRAGVAALVHQYKLTPKQVQTVAGLAGFDISRARARQLIAAYGQVPKNQTTAAQLLNSQALKNAQATRQAYGQNLTGTFTAHASLNASAAVSAAARARAQIAAQFGSAITQRVVTVYSSQGAKNRAGHATGGLLRGPGTATSDSIPIMASDGEYMMQASAVQKYGPAMMDAINGGRYATGGPIGRPASGGAVDSAVYAQATRQAAAAGKRATEAYNDAEDAAHKKHLSKAVQAARDRAVKVANAEVREVKRVADAIAKVTDARREFIGGFQSSFGGSVFGQSNEDGTPTTLAELIAAQQSKAIGAQQTRADVTSALGKGLSKSLLAQLQASGDTASLHAIAGGSAAQIAQLNQLNSQTSTALKQAGTAAGDAEYVGRLADAIKGHKTIVNVHLTGKTVVKEVRTYQKGEGVTVTV